MIFGNLTSLKKNTIRCLLKILILLGLFDLIATIYWISAGLATEANPIMKHFLDNSYYSFACVKLFFMFAGVLILNQFKKIKRKLIFKISFWFRSVLFKEKKRSFTLMKQFCQKF